MPALTEFMSSSGIYLLVDFIVTTLSKLWDEHFGKAARIGR